MTNAAVITGDLIASRQARPDVVAETMDLLTSAANDVEAALGQSIRLTRFRGDGWQILLPNAGSALRAALTLRCKLAASPTALQTRMAIGIGPIDTPGTRSLADAAGEAFSASGHALDTMGKRLLVLNGQQVTPALKALTALIEHIMGRWTEAQAEAMGLQLLHPAATQEEIAAQLNVTRQAIQLRLSAAGKVPVLDAVAAFDHHFKQAGPPNA